MLQEILLMLMVKLLLTLQKKEVVQVVYGQEVINVEFLLFMMMVKNQT